MHIVSKQMLILACFNFIKIIFLLEVTVVREQKSCFLVEMISNLKADTNQKYPSVVEMKSSPRADAKQRKAFSDRKDKV
jgi:hypothetical protein